jgi:hypothetical protein
MQFGRENSCFAGSVADCGIRQRNAANAVLPALLDGSLIAFYMSNGFLCIQAKGQLKSQLARISEAEAIGQKFGGLDIGRRPVGSVAVTLAKSKSAAILRHPPA